MDDENPAGTPSKKIIYKVVNYRQGSPEIEIDHYVPVNGSVDEVMRGRFHVVAPYIYPLGIAMKSGIGNVVFQLIAMRPELDIVPLGSKEDPLIGVSGVVQWDIPDSGKTTIADAFAQMRAELSTHVKRDIDKILKEIESVSKQKIALPSELDVRQFGKG